MNGFAVAELIPIRLQVNGDTYERTIEPRISLGDFLRKDLGLTGTHLSCEHGICGACTVLIDGKPQRSCITFAVTCDKSQIETVEGYSDDPLMIKIRDAFHKHHALQCGFCTPGMLCAARDIVLRLDKPDEQRVRFELAGNLCRCTGYVGIVEAIQSVLAEKESGDSIHFVNFYAPKNAAQPITDSVSLVEHPDSWVCVAEPDWSGAAVVKQSRSVQGDTNSLWKLITRLETAGPCIPGVTIKEVRSNENLQQGIGAISIRFGPISAEFEMRADLRIQSDFSASLVAEGKERKTSTSVCTRLDFDLADLRDGGGKLNTTLRFYLRGPLAQFSRSALVEDYVSLLLERTLEQIQVQLENTTTKTSGDPLPFPGEPRPNPTVNPPQVSMLSILFRRLKRLLRL